MLAVIMLKSEQCCFAIDYRKNPKNVDTWKNTVKILKL